MEKYVSGTRLISRLSSRIAAGQGFFRDFQKITLAFFSVETHRYTNFALKQQPAWRRLFRYYLLLRGLI